MRNISRRSSVEMLYSSLARLLDNIVNRQDLQEIDSNFLYTNKKNGSYQDVYKRQTLRNAIRNYDFNPFDGILHAQQGLISKDANHTLTPREIISIDWLLDNIIGRIPTANELREDAQNVVRQEGIRKEEPTT